MFTIDTEDVYMRPEMKPTRIEISTYHKKNSVYITFYRGRNEMKFVSGVVRDKHPIKKKPVNFVYACADVSFHMISFRVVFTWCFITRNETSFLSKWPQWNNARNEFHFRLYHVNSYKKLTRQRNKNISFHPKWNPM